jgi:hypothetical protein
MEDKDFISKRSVDIVFLVDTSGSMSDEIEAVKSSCQNFADKIIREGKDVRLGLVGFSIEVSRLLKYANHVTQSTRDFEENYRRERSQGNYITHELSEYTIGIWNLKTPVEFKKNVQTLSLGLFGGGGCYIANEDTVEILPYIANVFDKYGNSKILVIISDEIGSNAGLSQITDLLKKEKVVTYVMGVPKEPNGAHQMIAQTTGGEFWDITKTKGTQDFSKLLGNVADKIIMDLTARGLNSNNQSINEKQGNVEIQKPDSDNTILADSIISKFDKSMPDISSTINKF